MANKSLIMTLVVAIYRVYDYLRIVHDAAAELVRRKSEPEHARILKWLLRRRQRRAARALNQRGECEGVEMDRFSDGFTTCYVNMGPR